MVSTSFAINGSKRGVLMICQGDSVIRDNSALHMPQVFLSPHLIFHKISCQFRSVNSIYDYLIQHQNCAKISWILSSRCSPIYFVLDLFLIQAGIGGQVWRQASLPYQSEYFHKRGFALFSTGKHYFPFLMTLICFSRSRWLTDPQKEDPM